MPFLLARLGNVKSPGVRAIEARHVTTDEQVLPDLMALPNRAIVLLEGEQPPWTLGRVVPRPGGLPRDIGPMNEVWEQRRSHGQAVRILEAVAGPGIFAVDDSDTPVEYATCKPGSGARYILNYAGWQIADFPDAAVQVVVCDTAAGAVWLVPHDAVPHPATARTAPTPFATMPTPARSAPPEAHGVDRDSRATMPVPMRNPSPAPTPQPIAIEVNLCFVDIELLDGAISFLQRCETIRARSEHARAVYNDLREPLDQELPSGVRVVGTIDQDGDFTGTVSGLDALEEIFELVRWKVFIRSAVERATWLDAGDVVIRRPGAGGSRDPLDLLGIPEAGLGPRADALRRLFMHRDTTERVRVLLGRAVIIPLLGKDGGLRWYAWETVEDDHATYLFRPEDEAALAEILAWTQGEARRQQLIDERELQAQLGYRRRVRHHSKGEDQLGSWWAKLCGVIGLSG